MLEIYRHTDNIFSIFHDEFGEVSVTEVDTAFVIDFVTGDIVSADGVEKRLARPSNGARDVSPVRRSGRSIRGR